MSTLVTVRPIYNDADLESALNRLDAIFDALPGTPDGDERSVLADLIEACERRHRAIVGPVDPIEAIRFHMDRLGLRQVDLVPYMGARSRVSEVLAGKRKLTVDMIGRLSRGLGIPAEDLLGSNENVEK